MRRKVYVIAALLAALFIGIQTAQAADSDEETLYSQVNMYSLKGKYFTWVNYSVDALIPVNTPVVIKRSGWSGKAIVIKSTGQTLKLKNKERHSGLSDDAWIAKHFAKHKVDLSKFNQLEQEGIRSATVKVGMRKEAVIVARGYPPAHRTPSLESSTWYYWHTRWNKQAVNFDSQGKVISIRE